MMPPETLLGHSQLSGNSSVSSRLWSETDSNYTSITFDRPTFFRPGPRTQLERMSWSDQLWELGDGRQRDRLVMNLRRLWIMSCFTGMCSFQQLLLQIVQTVNKHLAQPMTVPQETIAHEKKAVRRQFISELHWKYRPTHLCSDVLDRLSQTLRDSIAEKMPCPDATVLERKRAHRDIMYTIYSEPTQTKFSAGGCLLHPTSTTCYDCRPDVTQLSIALGGVPCVGVSSMNNNAAGDGDPSFVPACAWYAICQHVQPDVVSTECTPRYDAGQMSLPLADTHKIHAMTLCGSMTGDVVDRPRFQGLGLSHRCVMTRPIEKFHEDIAHSVDFELSDLWDGPLTWHQHEIQEYGEFRVHPVDGLDCWDNVLLPSQRENRDEYVQKMDEDLRLGKQLNSANLIADLNQRCGPIDTPKRPRCTYETPTHNSLPCVVTHHCLWNFRRGYPLLSLESAQAHGWPVLSSHRNSVGCITSFEELIETQRLRCTDLRQMVGDGWQLRTMGMWYMWLLMNLELRSDSARFDRSPTLLKLQRHLSSPLSIKSSEGRCSIMTIEIPSDDDDGNP